MTIGQAGVGTQLTEGYITMVHAMLVSIGAFVAVAMIGAFVSLAVTVHERELSALIVLLVLRGIVDTNAIVLRDLAVGTNAIVLLVVRPQHPMAYHGRQVALSNQHGERARSA